jgi:hypothetical protein
MTRIATRVRGWLVTYIVLSSVTHLQMPCALPPQGTRIC